VTDLLARVASLFLEPGDAVPTARSRRAVAVAPAPSVGVLTAQGEGLAVASAIALTLARATRSRPALVCAWPPGALGRVALVWPPAPAARKLRRSLQARGIECTAAGQVVRVVLPEPAGDAVATAERAIGAASCPAVLVVAGPRPEELDELLLRQDAIVVAAPESGGPVVDLAIASLAERHPAVAACSLPLGPVGRVLAGAGAAAPLGSGRPLAPMLEAVT
jgi:hypothetical protein